MQAVLAARPAPVLGHVGLPPLQGQRRDVQQVHGGPHHGALGVRVHPQPLLHVRVVVLPPEHDGVARAARVPVAVPEVTWRQGPVIQDPVKVRADLAYESPLFFFLGDRSNNKKFKNPLKISFGIL